MTLAAALRALLERRHLPAEHPDHLDWGGFLAAVRALADEFPGCDLLAIADDYERVGDQDHRAQLAARMRQRVLRGEVAA